MKFDVWEPHKEPPGHCSFPFDRAILTTVVREVMHAFLHHERSYICYTHAQRIVLAINVRNFFSILFCIKFRKIYSDVCHLIPVCQKGKSGALFYKISTTC
jgi:hypothetical protein